MSNIKAQMQGRRNKAAGKAFEQDIEIACEYYWAKGLAHIEKTPEPFRVVRSVGAGKFEGYYEKFAQPDYKGVLKGGRCVCFEAKHTDTDRIKQDAVLLQQAESLTSHQELGALCFVMVSILHKGVYKVPWNVFSNMKEHFGHKYATAEELKDYKVQQRNGIILFLEQEIR